MGILVDELMKVGGVMGIKVVVNEFVVMFDF